MPTATCLCGACHIVISHIIGAGLCHCTICRKMTSSAYSITAPVDSSAFHLERGTPKKYALTADSGTKSTLYFCGDCGSKTQLRRADVIRCKECGGRVLYKERTKRYALCLSASLQTPSLGASADSSPDLGYRMVQFEAR